MRIPQSIRALCVAAVLLAAACRRRTRRRPTPSQQIRIVCPFPAGGGTDLTSRLLGEQMQKILGQPVVVDNRTGASGMIGTEAVGESEAGRLHAARRVGRDRAESASLSEDGVRLGPRAPADHAAREGAERDGGAHRRAREERRGADRLREEESGQAHVLVERRRQSAAADRRALQQDGGREDPARAVQGRRAAARRARGRGSHADLREHRRREAVHRKRAHPADRRHLADARRRAARRARDRGASAARRLRARQLLRVLRAGRPARPDPEAAQRDRGADHEDARPRREVQEPGFRARARHAGAIPRVHPRRIGEIRQDHRRSGHQA